MTAEQLEELLAVIDTQDGQSNDYWCAVHKLNTLAPSLARRVLAAEKLVEALREIAGMDAMGSSAVAFNALTAYREANK